MTIRIKGFFKFQIKEDYALWGIKQDWTWDVGSRLSLKSGFDIKELATKYKYASDIGDVRINSDPELYQFERSLDISLQPKGKQYSFYLNSKFQIAKQLIAETGIRYDQSTYSNDKL